MPYNGADEKWVDTSHLSVSGGKVGRLSPCDIEFRPLTILIGENGTGKATAMRLARFMEDASHLVPLWRGQACRSGDTWVEKFSEFIPSRAEIPWAGRGRRACVRWQDGDEEYGMSPYLMPDKYLTECCLREVAPPTTTYLDTFRNEEGKLFGGKQRAIDLGRGILRGRGDTPSVQEENPIEPLGGEMSCAAIREAAEWMWALRELGRKLEWERRNTLYVEEPEMGLHPAAQVRMAELLAYVTNWGFRVVISTYSLTMLYTINNLMVAAELPEWEEVDGSPTEDVRISKESVSAYCFSEEGVRDIMDREEGLISEEELGSVGAELEAQLNHMAIAGRKGR